MRQLLLSFLFVFLNIGCDLPNDSNPLIEVSEPELFNVDSLFYKYDVKGIELNQDEFEFLVKEGEAKNLKIKHYEALKEMKRNR